MMNKLAAALLMTVLAGCGVGPETDEADDLKSSRVVAAPITAPLLRTTAARVTNPAWQSTYEIAATADVFFAFEVPLTTRGVHDLAVMVKLGDSTYVRYDLRFSTDVKAPAGAVRAEKTATSYRVWTSLPVAGTDIEMYGLSGPWAADAYLDTAAVPSAKVAFTLN